MSMAHGLEVRVPWLDAKTIEACLSIPSSLKRRGKNGKRVLKEMLSQDLPRELTHRRKAGFLVPLESWLQDSWQPLLRLHLTEQFAEETGFFYWPVLSRMMDEQRSGKADHAYALFTLLILSVWWETWISGKRKPIFNRPAAAKATSWDTPSQD
jgi:asparagine synthase (glutamine-hydrolysing)